MAEPVRRYYRPERVTRGGRRCVRDRPGMGEDRLRRLCGRQEPQRGGHPVSSREKHRVPGDGSSAQPTAREREREGSRWRVTRSVGGAGVSSR